MQVCSAEILEVVKLYVPITLAGTESFTETLENEVIDYGVYPTTRVLAGGMPEDIIHALQQPFTLTSPSDNYVEQETNLFVLVGAVVKIESQEGGLYQLTLTCEQELDNLSSEQVGHLLYRSIRRTLMTYFTKKEAYYKIEFSHGSVEEEFEIGVKP